MRTTIKTNSKEFLSKLDTYISDCVNYDYLNISKDITIQAKCIAIKNTFMSETWSDYEKKIYKNNLVLGLANFLQGIPSCFHIDFENFRIIEIAKEWNTIPQNATEKQEDRVLSNWYNLIANRIINLSN